MNAWSDTKRFAIESIRALIIAGIGLGVAGNFIKNESRRSTIQLRAKAVDDYLAAGAAYQLSTWTACTQPDESAARQWDADYDRLVVSGKRLLAYSGDAYRTDVDRVRAAANELWHLCSRDKRYPSAPPDPKTWRPKSDKIGDDINSLVDRVLSAIGTDLR